MSIEDKYDLTREILEWLQTMVHDELSKSPKIVGIVHSVKSRIKSKKSLLEKIDRKRSEGKEINEENLFKKITDLVGVRVLILFPQHFKNIHGFIKFMEESGRWTLVESPKVYTWDDDLKKFFLNVGIDKQEFKESLYTSVHYIVKINNEEDTPCCEIQVRTLFEEVFGEVDHKINYPIECSDEIKKNQLKTLSKFVAAGTKLLETIYLNQENPQCHTPE